MLSLNSQLLVRSYGNVLYEGIPEVLKDGVLDSDEEKKLLEILLQLTPIGKPPPVAARLD